MNKAEAWRCIRVCAKYLRERDESPRAAHDLLEAVELLVKDATNERCAY